MVIINGKGINKWFEMSKTNRVHVLRNVDLEILSGEFVSIMGPSGSGKSTLLYNISGMDRLTSGEVIFRDTDITTASDRDLSDLRLNNMGFVFQQSHLLKDLSIMDNILLPGFASNKFTREEIVKRGEDLIKGLGIETITNNMINEASGGQLQRVSIARALINEPEILFGDEPTGALNSSMSEEVMSIFSEINQKGKTVLVVTHDARVAARSDRVLFMIDGKIVESLELGKYNSNDDLSLREQQLSAWLVKHGI